jgi:hypothetical protein
MICEIEGVKEDVEIILHCVMIFLLWLSELIYPLLGEIIEHIILECINKHMNIPLEDVTYGRKIELEGQHINKVSCFAMELMEVLIFFQYSTYIYELWTLNFGTYLWRK